MENMVGVGVVVVVVVVVLKEVEAHDTNGVVWASTDEVEVENVVDVGVDSESRSMRSRTQKLLAKAVESQRVCLGGLGVWSWTKIV